jgi:hypothetical protein
MIGPVPRHQNLLQRKSLDASAVLNEHFGHVQPLPLDRFRERSVLGLLAGIAPRKHLNEAVEAGINRCQEWCLLKRWVGGY